MRLLFLPSDYLPEKLGGTELYVHHLSEALVALNHEVLVAYHAQSAPTKSIQVPYQIAVLPSLPKPRRVDIYSCDYGAEPPGFRQLLENYRPDIVHFHSFSLGAGMGHAKLAMKFNIPYFITYHFPGISCPRQTLIRWGKTICDGKIDPRLCAACMLQREGCPRPVASLLGHFQLSIDHLPDGPWITWLGMRSLITRRKKSWEEWTSTAVDVISPAKWVKDILLLNGIAGEKISVLRQALPGITHYRRLRLPIQGQRLRLGFFARLSWVKGPDLFLEACERLWKMGIEMEGELVGPIELAEANWVKNLLGRFPRVNYLGVKVGNDLRNWIRSIDLLVIPSRWMETGPLTLLEAWDECVPVIGTNAGGIREFFETAGLTSLLFEWENVDSLVQAILRAKNWNLPSPEVKIPGMEDLTQAMLSIYRGASSKIPIVKSR